MKRFFVLLMAVVTLLMTLPLSGTAAQTPNPAVTVSQVEGKADSDVTVTLSLADNPGLTAFRFTLDYDSNILELTDASFPALLSSPASGGNLSADPYIISWFSPSSDNENASGVFAELTFHIKAGSAEGNYPLTIGYDPLDILDKSFNEITLDKQNGGVYVLPCSHTYDVLGIQCTQCGVDRLNGYMQMRSSEQAGMKDFRFLVESKKEIFGGLDYVILQLNFTDVNGNPVRSEPLLAKMDTVYTSIRQEGYSTYNCKPDECIGGVIIRNIPDSAGVHRIDCEATFVKGDISLTYTLGSVTIN